MENVRELIGASWKVIFDEDDIVLYQGRVFQAPSIEALEKYLAAEGTRSQQ